MIFVNLNRALLTRLAADRVLCSSYEQVLCCPFASKAELELLQSAQFHPPLLAQSLPLEDKLLALRRLVISAGLPATEYFCLPADGAASLQRTTAAPSLRTCVWKVLLGALLVDASVYLALMKVGVSNHHILSACVTNKLSFFEGSAWSLCS